MDLNGDVGRGDLELKGPMDWIGRSDRLERIDPWVSFTGVGWSPT